PEGVRLVRPGKAAQPAFKSQKRIAALAYPPFPSAGPTLVDVDGFVRVLDPNGGSRSVTSLSQQPKAISYVGRSNTLLAAAYRDHIVTRELVGPCGESTLPTYSIA